MGRRIFALIFLLACFACPLWAQVPPQNVVITSEDGLRTAGVAGTSSDALKVTCVDGTCSGSGGTTDTDDGTVAGGQTAALALNLNYLWNGANWVRFTGDATNGLKVQCASGCTPGGSFADNSAFTFGTTSINPTGYVFDDVAPNAVTENNAAAPRMSGNRIPYGILRDAAGNERGANVNASFELLTTASQSGAWTVTANAGTGTFTVGAVNLDIRDLVFATDKVDVSGSSVTVTATDLDIRNLVFATDKVDASGTTLGANSGVDIGDVTVNNAAGAAAVNIQDGGNSITVDGAVTVSGTVTANQGTPASTANRWPVQITDGTDLALVSGTGSVQVTCDNCGGSTFADNSAFTFGTTNITNVGYVFDDASPNAVTENNAATPRMSGNRVPYSILRDAAGNERGANVTAANALVVDGSAVTQPVSGTVNIGTFPDNEPFNLAQVAGTATSTGVGASGAGTQRVAALVHDGTDTAQVTATGGGSLQVECSAGCGGAAAAVTANAPQAATVGTTSASCLASNVNRKAAFFVNTSNRTISIAESGQTAVLNSGVTLAPGSAYSLIPPFLTTGQVNCIASGAGANLSILEKQ